MVCLGKGIFFNFAHADPSMGDRAVSFDPAGFISAAKYVHDNFKMGVGVLDLGDRFYDFGIDVCLFFDFPQAGLFSAFFFPYLAAGKFPESAQKPVRFPLGNQHAILF